MTTTFNLYARHFDQREKSHPDLINEDVVELRVGFHIRFSLFKSHSLDMMRFLLTNVRSE